MNAIFNYITNEEPKKVKRVIVEDVVIESVSKEYEHIELVKIPEQEYDYKSLTLIELREMFPDIKARSKEKFLKLI